jgi:hypothetical protein
MRLKIRPCACFWQTECGCRCWRIKTAVEFNRRSLMLQALAFGNIHKTQFRMFLGIVLEEKWGAE